MSSESGGSHHGGENEDIEADEAARNKHARSVDDLQEGDDDGGAESPSTVVALDARMGIGNIAEDSQLGTPVDTTLPDDDYAQIGPDSAHRGDDPAQERHSAELSEVPSLGVVSPAASSIPDDTPSLQGSLLSSPAGAASPSPRGVFGRKVSGALQPFERRFEARPTTLRSTSLRSDSPAFLSPHSRQLSISSRISQISSQDASAEADTPQTPWDVMKWTKLRKITTQAFSESGRRSFGRPTCLAVSALIAIGTSKGLILGFDYHQTLKIIIGQGTKATECGSITALAIAADYSTIASGHANGHIFTWQINRPSQPFLRIPPLDRGVLSQQKHPDGHVEGCAILHIGFLGTRHTAVVSADAAGMAFSHLATRGLGPVTRTIGTTRLLGRYPSSDALIERNRKPSSVLAFSPLPLGNLEQATDGMGLTALLTPYLLVVVSTLPTAQTQHKASRPKEISPHSTLSGCLAWFPAVKLKRTGDGLESGSSKTKLVYCWSNVLSILDITVEPIEQPAKVGVVSALTFRVRNRWRAEEAIVAVQWLGRSVLGVLTVSQRLLILEDVSLQVTDSIDLLQKHMYHQDLFSQQLKGVVEQLSTAEPSLHGVVADAFYMAFRVYKGRTFLLGFEDLTVGSLSNWADRLVALMEAGDYIAAIRLATEYYAGGASNVTVGLPDMKEVREDMVRQRLIGMITASLDYTFAQEDEGRDARLRELAVVSFDACIAMHQEDHLFNAVFGSFEDAEQEDVFISTLEPYILDDEIKSLPPEIVRSLVSYFISENQAARLEELLCRLDPHAFDLDQITMLCRQHRLYDALIYVWTQAINDFVTPLIELLMLVKLLQVGGDDEHLLQNPYYESASKVFSYLAYTLTGRRYPSGSIMEEDAADHAKEELYEYVLSGAPAAWPHGSQTVLSTADSADLEPAYPYLVLLLQFDTSSFMSMLNEAFEDPFLNSADNSHSHTISKLTNGTNNASYTITRDRVISVLLDVMKQDIFNDEQTIFLDMFIARSLPKYPSEIVLPGSLLGGILQHLCKPPSEDLRDDCQLSVEYLLSAYQPPDISPLIKALQEARFFRVLKSIYTRSKQWVELLQTFLKDPDDKASVFDCIALCLRSSTGTSPEQLGSIKDMINDHLQDLLSISVNRTAFVLATHASDLLEAAIQVTHDSHMQFIFLRTLFEPRLLDGKEGRHQVELPVNLQASFLEMYVRLMCTHDRRHVADYVGMLPTSDLRLAEVLPSMESSGVIDAAVVLLSREGLANEGMDRLTTHLDRLREALQNLVDAASEAPDPQSAREATDDLVEGIVKYTKVGLWLCQGQTANVNRKPRRRAASAAWDIEEDDLDLDEYLWLNLIDSVVHITKSLNEALRRQEDHPTEASVDALDLKKVSSSLRANVQQCFTALLTATATTVSGTGSGQESVKLNSDRLSFLRIFRTFLKRAAQTAPSLTDLRAILSDTFSAYAFEEGVLSLGNELLGSDVFAQIEEANKLRQSGWRPRTQVCEYCKRRAWGPGMGEIVWDEWIGKEQEREAEKDKRSLERSGGEEARRFGRGKAKAKAVAATSDSDNEDARRLTLVVFNCRHVFHRVCLDEGYRDGKHPSSEPYRCPLCIDQV